MIPDETFDAASTESSVDGDGPDRRHPAENAASHGEALNHCIGHLEQGHFLGRKDTINHEARDAA